MGSPVGSPGRYAVRAQEWLTIRIDEEFFVDEPLVSPHNSDHFMAPDRQRTGPPPEHRHSFLARLRHYKIPQFFIVFHHLLVFQIESKQYNQSLGPASVTANCLTL